MIQRDHVTASIRISATPADVFPYLTASLLIKWLGTWADTNPEPGGIFAVNIGDQSARGQYVSVEPPHRVVFTWGIPNNDDLPPGGSTVEILLTAEGDETEVNLIHRNLPTERQPDHLAGWTSLLDNLRATAEAISWSDESAKRRPTAADVKPVC